MLNSQILKPRRFIDARLTLNHLSRSIAGDFSPSEGDFVFSQTGELLGLLANDQYCHVITGVSPAAATDFGLCACDHQRQG